MLAISGQFPSQLTSQNVFFLGIFPTLFGTAKIAAVLYMRVVEGSRIILARLDSNPDTF